MFLIQLVVEKKDQQKLALFLHRKLELTSLSRLEKNLQKNRRKRGKIIERSGENFKEMDYM